MNIEIIVNYETEEVEFDQLNKKYPTGEYKHTDNAATRNTMWFVLYIGDLELTWFLSPSHANRR